MAVQFHPATRTTLSESVISQLRDAILVGELPPGTHLAEVDLSARLGVSRATLREGTRHLEQEGLLVQDHRGRLSVRRVTSKGVRDLFDVRLALELMALSRVCALENRSAAVHALTAALAHLQDHDHLMLEGMEADLELHRTLCALPENPMLLQAWTSLSGLVRVTMVAAGPESALTNMAHSRHAPLIEFVRRGDIDGGSTFLQTHMDEASKNLISTIEATPS